ncbi:MAG TPA: hypothetical protein DDY98_03335 [Ruminococcaceae bacterium]|nr:hypothetical protein [Oscillospiraceae bacterium]
MYCYGWGDGGGGVDTEMLEYVKRYKKFPGLPTAEVSKIEDSLARMKAKATDTNIPTWKDELYLEEHRGVHTTKALLKKYNRKCENELRQAEIFCSVAMKMGNAYPLDQLNEAWQRLLTTQFHDGLPGSHITEVFHDMCNEYEEILAIIAKVKDAALNTIAGNIDGSARYGKPFALFNSLGVAATSKVEMPYKDAEIYDAEGKKVPVQAYTKPDGTKVLCFVAKNVPACGYKVYYAKPAAVPQAVAADPSTFENDFFSLKFDERAELVSVFDKKNNREVLSGKGNAFRLYEDLPGKYDAWDIVATYVDREFDTPAGKIEGMVKGDVFTCVTVSKVINRSRVLQNIIIYNELDRIDFDTFISWHEQEKLLKVGFDVDIKAQKYTRDIAYATIESSNYRHNPYDKAKFEVSAHNFIDMSEDGYGLSILNDCKYGFEVDKNRMIITLLKAPMNPDPESDRGDHYFTYSLYPHAGDWKDAGTLAQGLAFNNPLTAVEVKPESKGETKGSFVRVSADNVPLEALKKCEDEDAYIIRFVEKAGRRTKVDVDFFTEIAKATEVNLLEREDVAFDGIDGKQLKFEINPFEIKTFKLFVK